MLQRMFSNNTMPGTGDRAHQIQTGSTTSATMRTRAMSPILTPADLGEHDVILKHPVQKSKQNPHSCTSTLDIGAMYWNSVNSTFVAGLPLRTASLRASSSFHPRQGNAFLNRLLSTKTKGATLNRVSALDRCISYFLLILAFPRLLDKP